MKRLPPDHSGVVGKSRVRLRAAAELAGLPNPHCVVMEVMPKETGTGGASYKFPSRWRLPFLDCLSRGNELCS